MAKSVRREEMRQLLDYREQHGLTYRELAEECGASAHTLSWWAWRLKREKREEAAFVEVEVTGSFVARGLEVEVPSGYVVRVPCDFDSVALQRVLEVLASC